MFGFSNKFKKIILSVLLGVVLLVNFSGVAMAQEEEDSRGFLAGLVDNGANYITKAIEDSVSSMWAVVVYGTAYSITFIAQKVFGFLGFLMEGILTMNVSIAQNPLVEQGWTILRNLTNLGFVLAIIFIAFATMLRIESYGIKRLFLRLIAIALLINFSLALAGIILNFSNSLTQFFIESAATKGQTGTKAISSMMENLAASTNINSLLKIPEKQTLGSYADYVATFDVGKDFFNTFAGLVFAGGFTVLAAMVLGAVVVISFIRYFIITGLLIIAPLAWLSFVVPPIDYFKKWWDKLLQWSFFMPVMMFFLYLAVIIAVPNSAHPELRNDPASPYAISSQVLKNSSATQQGFVNGVLGDMFGNYFNIIIACAMMVMGLIIGEKMGVGMSKTTLLSAGWAKQWAMGAIGGAAGVAAGGTGWTARRLLSGGLDKEGRTRGERFAAGISQMPIIGTVFGGVARGVDQYSRPLKTAPDEVKKELGSLNDNLLVTEANNKVILSDAEAAAYIKELAGRKGKLLKKIDTERLKYLMDRAKLFGVKDDVYKQRLDLVPDEDVKKMVQKMDPKKFLEEVDDDMLKEVRFVEAMKDKQKEKLFSDGSETNKLAYLEGLDKLIVKLKTERKDVLDNEHIEHALIRSNLIGEFIEKAIDKDPTKYENLANLLRELGEITG